MGFPPPVTAVNGVTFSNTPGGIGRVPVSLGTAEAAWALAASRMVLVTQSVGLIAEHFPMQQMRVVNTGLANGSLFGQAVGLFKGETIANILIVMAQAGIGTSPTTIRFGIADNTATVQAVTANVASDAQFTGAVGILSFPLSAAYIVPATGLYYLLCCQNGAWVGTNTQFGSGSNAIASLSRIGTSPWRVFQQTGVTDLPAVGAAATPANAALAYWLGCN